VAAGRMVRPRAGSSLHRARYRASGAVLPGRTRRDVALPHGLKITRNGIAMNSRRQFFQYTGLAALMATASSACRRGSAFEWIAGRRPADRVLASASASGAAFQTAVRCVGRLAYGARPGDVERVASMGPDAWIEEQLSPASISDWKTFWRVRRIETVGMDAPDLFDYAGPSVISDLRRATILRSVYSERQLLERMVEFWSDHFN